MDIKEYFTKINLESQRIFLDTLNKNAERLGKGHHLTYCIFEFSELIPDKDEKDMLVNSSTQIESATYNMLLGLYRQAFSSLRLAFEMSLGMIKFSIDKLEQVEWLKGKADIKWSTLIDKDSGVLSARFSNAFFEELSPFVGDFNARAIVIYRSLSEFVHGNSETWTKEGIKLKINDALINDFFESLYEISEIILFALSCRYLPKIPKEKRETMEFLSTHFGYIEPIRVILGGPKK
jgi:hypothetical protein